MKIWNNYYLAESIEDALAMSSTAPGSTRFIAGGTDLLLDLQQGRQNPLDTLIDVTNIPEMTLLEIRQERLFIGAAVPLYQVVESPLVQVHAQAVYEACSLIGGPQVRNTATLGGNVAHALPAADGTIALLAMDAQASIVGMNGERQLHMGELFLGPGRSTLEENHELLLGFSLPLKNGRQASTHRRIMRPQGVAIAILNMAIWLQRTDQEIEDIHIAVGPAGPTPFRAINTESVLRGQVYGPDIIHMAMETLLAEARFRTSPHRATEQYRRHMAGVLLHQAVEIAWNRASSDDAKA